MTYQDICSHLEKVVSCCAKVDWTSFNTFEFSTFESTLSLRILCDLKKSDFIPIIFDSKLQRKLDRQQLQDDIPSGTRIQLQVPRSLQEVAVVSDLKNLLQIYGIISCEPASYIIVPPHGAIVLHIKGESTRNLPLDFQRYHHAVALWKLLESKCHHFDSSRESLLFFGIRRLELLPLVESRDLNCEIKIKEISSFCNAADNEEIRSDIFSSELSELLKDNNPSSAFRSLIRINAKFARRLREGLAIYMATKTPVKLLEEARNSSLGFHEKVEKLVAGIELKALGIPAAILLGVKDVEKGAGFTTSNMIIISSTALFAGTMFLVHHSQKSLISALSSSIKKAKEDFTNRGLEITNPDLEVSFGSLTSRLSIAKSASRIIMVLSFCPVLAILAAMYFADPTIQIKQDSAPQESNNAVGVRSN